MTDLITAPDAGIPARDSLLATPNPGATDWDSVKVQHVGGLIMLADTTVAVPAATINFPAIPAGFNDLILTVNGQLTGAADFVWASLNGDTAVNYRWLRGVFQSGAVSGTSGTATGLLAGLLDGAGVGASFAGVLEATFYNYLGTTFRKRCLTRSSLCTGATAAQLNSEASSSEWSGTAAVNAILLTPNSGNFGVGTRATLYGRR